MASTVILLEFGNQAIRVYLDDEGNPWWVAKDVCAALGLKDYQHYRDKLDDVERSKHLISSAGTRRMMVTVNQAGLEKLLLEAAEEAVNGFRKWFHEAALPEVEKKKSTPNKRRVTLKNAHENEALRALRRQEDQVRRIYEMSGLRQLDEYERGYKTSSLRQLEEIQRGLNEVQRVLRPSCVDFFEDMKRMARPQGMDFLNQAKRAYGSISGSLLEQIQNLNTNHVYGNLQDAIGTGQQFREMMKLYSTEKLFQSAFNKVQEFIRLQPLQFHTEIEKVLESLSDFNQIIHGFASEDIVVNPDSTVTISGNVVTLEEVHSIVEEALDSSGLLTESGFSQGLDVIKAEIKKATSVRKALLVGIILFFLQPLVQPYIDNFYEKAFPAARQRAVRLIKKETLKSVDDPIRPSNIRFVSTDVLLVMGGNSRRSQVVGKLYFGAPVFMIHKKKNWSLIEWSNGDSVLRGWVFTRYLERFK